MDIGWLMGSSKCGVYQLTLPAKQLVCLAAVRFSRDVVKEVGAQLDGVVE